MIADTIKRTDRTLEARGIPADSYFQVTFEDGSRVTEKEVNWSAMSEKAKVSYFGDEKNVRLAVGVKLIEVFYEGMYAAIEVPDGCTAYQAIRSDSLIVPGVLHENKVIGRLLGIVRNGEVIEERFLDGLQLKVQGMRK